MLLIFEKITLKMNLEVRKKEVVLMAEVNEVLSNLVVIKRNGKKS